MQGASSKTRSSMNPWRSNCGPAGPTCRSTPPPFRARPKLAAGWLIDKAGLKGCRSGRVGIHERQALVLVNLGGATGGEILDFARMVQARVHEKFGIEIDTEVNIL